MAKTANERLSEKKDTKKVLMDKDFAGIKAGQRMFVATPRVVADYISSLAYGETRTIPEVRAELAKANECDATCPVSTSIFIRIAAEAAIEDMDAGRESSEVIPFWRVLTATDKPVKKLNIDPEWITHQREAEQV